MTKDYIRQSILSSFIDGLLEEKRATGHSYRTEERILNHFDLYCERRQLNTTEITKEFLAGWMEQSESEGAFHHGKRISVVRQLMLFMAGLGIHVYVPHDFCHFKRAMPHIFDELEIRSFFHELDSCQPTPESPGHLKRMTLEYRLLFRMYYCCGLRNSEAAGIASENVDLENGVLTILNSKGTKDRLVYMPDDLTESCRDYYRWLCSELGQLPRWFFPGMNIDSPIPNTTTASVFRRYWAKTAYADCSNQPTIHDFRFTFVVKRMNMWAEEGTDLKVMMPYLSRYLGHKSINETMYYYFLVRDAYKTVQLKDTIAPAVIPEVRIHE